MSSINKSACALAVFAVAALAGPAFAGKPMNVIEKRAAAQAKAQQMQQVAGDQSATASDGTDTAVVPEELHNYMRVERDAQGKPHVFEQDGPKAPVSQKPEATNE